MKPLPCKTCILLPVCKSKVSQDLFKGMIKNPPYFLANELYVISSCFKMRQYFYGVTDIQNDYRVHRFRKLLR